MANSMNYSLLVIAACTGFCAIGALAQTPPPVYVVSTIAGRGSIGDAGPATSAILYSPRSVRTDAAGNVYFVDSGNNRVRKIAPDGTISTFFGAGAPAGPNPPGTPAQLAIALPLSIAFDKAGNLFVGQIGQILKIANGVTSVVAGGGASSADGVPATTAAIAVSVLDMVFGADGSLYFTDGARVRKIAPDGTITTVAGSTQAGFSGDGGPATAAQLRLPLSLAIDSGGNLYIADEGNGRIRKITADGNIATIAGILGGSSGDNGPAIAASLTPYGLAFDPNGVLYVTDVGNHTIRKITSDGLINRVAGAVRGFAGDNGPATQARLNFPTGLSFDGAGNLYFADNNNDRIRKIDPSGIITTIAGAPHFSGDNGPALAAQLQRPGHPAVDAQGNIYFADLGNNRVRKISTAGTVTTVAGIGLSGYSGDGGPATAASLDRPNGVAVDSNGNLYIADLNNDVVRKVSAAGIISTYAGGPNNGPLAGDGGPAVAAYFITPTDVAVDPAGNLFIADSLDSRVRKVTPDGKISTIAGSGVRGYGGDNGPAAAAQLRFPVAVATDKQGNVYIADSGNNRIRKVTPAGVITTIAGTGTPGSSGDGGPATAAQLQDPSAIAVDSAGNVYFTDDVANTVRRISAAGIIDTIAGGTRGFSGDGGPATAAAFNTPTGIAVDPQGNLIIADTYNEVMRKLTALPTLSVLSVVNGASFTAGGVAPGSLISIFGGSFASSPVGAVATPLPTTLGNLTVSVNGTAIPILFANATQINAQLPYNIAPGAATVLVTKTTGAGQPFMFMVSAAAPGIFQLRQDRGIAQNEDGSVNDAANPAPVGSVIVLYFTGQGQSDNAIPTGIPAPAAPLSRPTGSVSITIGGQPADVLFLGATPTFIGLSQANVRVPALPPGDQPVIITIGAGQSVPALISVK